MKKLLPLVALVLYAFAGTAQKISGTVKDSDGKGLSNVTVSLLNLNKKDSAIAKLAVSQPDGAYTFSGVKPGKYAVKATYVGYAATVSTAIDYTDGDISVPSMLLNKASGADLKGVTVSARKPMIEVKADKTVLNVEGTINAIGQDVLELLRKAPGVQIDRDENLSISGKNGVQVFIDGKPSPLAGKDLAEYLKSLQSAQVEAIEIITNPSAKYEAAGNAGIINIRLKRDKTLGTNGSVNGGYGIGIYNKFNGGLALNHRNKTFNLFGTYNANRNKNENPFDLHREVNDSLFNQHSLNINRNENHNFKFGADYIINRYTTIGTMINGVRGKSRSFNNNTTIISYMPTKAVDRQLNSTNTNVGNRENTNYNLNFKHSKPSGRDLNIDFDYSNYDNISDQLLTNIYKNAAGTAETSREINNMVSPTEINIYSGKIDYEQNFQKGRLGIGGKTSFIKTDNDFQRFNIVGSAKNLDLDKSNRFRYSENINAVYVNYNKQMKGWMYQVGVRLENTITEGLSTGQKSTSTGYVPYDSTFNRNYTNLFPSAAITINKNPKNQWSFSYSRRIDRPAYQDLNPFEFRLDAYTYQKGNTELTPQFTHALSVTNIYKFKLTTSLSYSHTDDVFSPLTEVYKDANGRTSASYLIKRNLAQQDNIALNISLPYQYKAYSLFVNANAFYSHFKSNNGQDRNIDIDVFSYRFFAQNSLKLSKTITAELSGWYQGPSLWGGTFRNRPMGQMDIGLQKVILQGKGNIRFALSDVFKTFEIYSYANYDRQYTRVNFTQESRVFRISFSYRFGSSTVKAARNRKTAAEDENSRANGGGGGFGN